MEMCRWSSVGRSIRLREGTSGVSWSDDGFILCVLFVCVVGSVMWRCKMEEANVVYEDMDCNQAVNAE